jgi:PGF-pre-PGF domain-containing protein
VNNFLSPTANGKIIAGCDLKQFDTEYEFSEPYCIGNTLYSKYTCHEGTTCAQYNYDSDIPVCIKEKPSNAVGVYPAGIICASGCVSGACIGGIQNETKPPIQNEANPPAAQVTEEPAIDGLCPADKVLICHKDKNEICAGEPSLIAAHLQHGDYAGRCANEKSDAKVVASFKANDNVDIEFNNSVKVSFRALNKKRDSKITITSRSRETPPLNIPTPARKVKKYLVIEHPDIDNSEIADSKLEFTVDDEWMKASNAKKEDVILSKYVADKWKDLKTTYVKSVGNIHYFSAESEGFSTFAVTLNNTAASPQQAIPPVQGQQDSEASDQSQENKEDGFVNRLLSPPFIIGASVFVVLLFILTNLPPRQKKEDKANPEEEKFRPVLTYIEKLKKKEMSRQEIAKELEGAGYDKATVERLLKFSFVEKK